MSTYTEKFNNHPSRQEMEKVVTKSNELVKGAGSAPHPDLLRLHTAALFLEGQLKNMNADILPLTMTDQLPKAAGDVIHYLTEYNNDANKLGRLVQANVCIDGWLTAIYPYVIVTSQSTQEAFKKAATAHYDSVQKEVEGFKNIYKTVKKQDKDMQEKYEKITGYHNKLFEQSEEDTPIEKQIEEIHQRIQEQRDKVNALHNELLVGDDENTSLQKRAHEAITLIENDKKEVSGHKDESDAIMSELSDFLDDMLGKEDEQKNRSGGMADELEALKSNMEQFEIDQKAKYSALNEQIESLLPGATSAGLATAYSDMKNSFKWPIILWNVVFFIVIGAMVWISLDQLSSIEGREPQLGKPPSTENWEEILKRILAHLPLYLPMIWVAYFAIRRRSEAARLKQEYAHKEAIAKSFEGYKKQIEDLGEEKPELLAELMGSSITAITFNASTTLGKKHDESTPAVEVAKELKGLMKNEGKIQ